MGTVNNSTEDSRSLNEQGGGSGGIAGQIENTQPIIAEEPQGELAGSLGDALSGVRPQGLFAQLRNAVSGLFGNAQAQEQPAGIDAAIGETASGIEKVPDIVAPLRGVVEAGNSVVPVTTAANSASPVSVARPSVNAGIAAVNNSLPVAGNTVTASDAVENALADNSLIASSAVQQGQDNLETGAAPTAPRRFQRPDNGDIAQPSMIAADSKTSEILNEVKDPEAVKRWFEKFTNARVRQARKYNESLKRWFKEERKKNPDLTEEEFYAVHPKDPEVFGDALTPVMDKAYKFASDYLSGRQLADENVVENIRNYMRTEGAGTEFKENFNLWRLLDRTTWDMKLGFFPIKSQKLTVNEKTGELEAGWSAAVEKSIDMLMDDFGCRGLDGKKTVFRAIRLYATMAIDHHGKMFGENQDEWSLTDEEFIDICRCMHSSIEMYGHPFVAPFVLSGSFRTRTNLRGTNIFPSGVIPHVIAEAMTGPDSKLIFKSGPKKGEPMTADDLVEAARQEFLNRTQPKMEAVLTEANSTDKHNLVAQKIACYSAMQAFARLDGMDASDFGERFNVDANQHFKLEEYADRNAEYAELTHGQYDTAAVNDRMNEKIKIVEAENMEGRKKKVSTLEASANLYTSAARTNAVLQPAIFLSAVEERGVGNLLTSGSLALLKTQYDVEGFDPPADIWESMKYNADEWLEAIDAAYMILEIGGPENLLLFAKRGDPMTPDNASKFLHDEVLRPAANKRAEWVMRQEEKLQKISQKMLRGDHAFRKSTLHNFLKALMVSNMAIANMRAELGDGEIDTYAGVCLNGQEMSNVFKANNGNVASFLTEIMATSAGKDALQIMNTNNIGQFNYLSYKVNKLLAQHGIAEATIAVFVDKFITYGMNFLYAMIPFSRTFTYLSLKQKEANRGDITAADFAIGGGLGSKEQGSMFKLTNDNLIGLKFNGGPGFYEGLKMNYIFDCVTLGRNFLTTILLGAVMAALGFDLPDDDENQKKNATKYKIGGNVGWGPDTDGNGEGDGIELMPAFWLNDLTQWGLPGAYAFAAALSGHGDRSYDLFMDCLYDQFDGNVTLDAVNMVKTLMDDVQDVDRMIKDPTYTPKFKLGNAALSQVLRVVDSITPLAPLSRSIARSALINGEESGMYASSKRFDKSSDWAISVNKTEYIDDDVERILRNHSAENWMLAGILDLKQFIFTPEEERDQTTGYFYTEMPIKTQQEPMAFVWDEMQEINYDAKPEGMTNAQYEYLCAKNFMQYIKDNFETPQDAKEQGFFITPDMRKACCNVLFSEINFADNEFSSRAKLQDFSSEQKFYDDYDYYDAFKQERYDMYYDYFAPGSMPTWMGQYAEIRSSYEKTYKFEDGTPATGTDKFLADFGKAITLNGLIDIFPVPTITTEYSLKGDHPTSLLPVTWTDYSTTDKMKRGWSGETVSAYATDDAIRLLEDEVIPKGKYEGKTVGDVYFGEIQENGERLHPENSTVGSRALYPIDSKTVYEPFKESDANGSIYGDMGVAGGEASDSDGAVSKLGSDSTGNSSTNESGSGNGTGNGDDEGTTPWKNKYDEDSKPPWDADWAPSSGKIATPLSIPDRARAETAAAGSPLLLAGLLGNTVANNIGDHLSTMTSSILGDDGSRGYPKTLYPYYSYGYGSRYNSGNYTPKIYSTSRSINADRPATMYSKTPRDARTTYLNPRFETKGSREAYERQDI